MILRTATSVRERFDVAVAESFGASRQTRPMSLSIVKRIELSWRGVPRAVETAVRRHFNEYGQRGKTFLYQPPPIASHTEAYYAYDGDLSVDRSNPRNVSISCTLVEAQAFD